MAYEIHRETVTRPSADRSLGELFSELTRDLSALFHQEIALAKVELKQTATKAGKGVGYLAGGAILAYTGFLALIAALIIGLGQAGLPWWLSAFIVGIVVAGAGGYLIWTGLNNLKQVQIAPQNTIETLKEDAEWATAQTH
jgi:hypothetical protein